MKRFIKVLVVFLAITFTAASCGGPYGGGGAKAAELVWWKTFDEPALIAPLIEEFQTANPNVKVNYIQKNIETYEDELLEALARGEGPDIFSIHNDWLPKHQAKMVPAPQDVLSLREFQENFLQVVSDDFLADSRIYALPLGIDVLALYYNKDILASSGIVRPPSSWEELVDMVPKITRVNNLGNFLRQAVALGTADNINRASDILALLMLQNNTPLYSQDPKAAIFDRQVQEGEEQFSPGARALEFYTQFANPAKLSYTWNQRSNNSIEAFAGGQVAMIFSYSYLRDTLAQKAPFLNYGITAMPQIAGSLDRVNFANYWGEGVAKQSKNPEAAWKFLKFITSKQALPKYHEAQKKVSSRIDLLEEQISDPEFGAFAESALSARSFYKPSSDAVERILLQMINDVVLRNVPSQNAVEAGAEKVNLLLRNF